MKRNARRFRHARGMSLGMGLSLGMGGGGGITGLGNLTFNSNVVTAGVPANGTILGATPTSTISATSLLTGYSINGTLRTWASDGSGAASSGTAVLTETLVGTAGSPRTSNVNLTINPSGYAPAFQFNDARNTQYIPLIS